MNCDENMGSNVYFHIQDEAERLLKEIELMKRNVENSELYAAMRFDLDHNETFQQCLFHLLGSHSHVQNGETSQRVERILPFTTEFDIKTSHEEIYTNVFSRFSWHFFDVGPNVNMETSLPVTKITKYERSGGDRHWLDWQRYLEEVFLEDMQSDMSSEGFAQFLGENRGPRRLRCNSVLPPLGWIKLNIYGIGTEGDQPGRFSGVFQDDSGICLGKYSGTIDANDNVIAGLEALRNGLVRCVEGKPKAQKLMVESDNVILIQYLNGQPEPNELTMCRLKEIFAFLKHITCAFYHVYEEANEAARDLALRDERHNRA